MTITATELRQLPNGPGDLWLGDARLYELSEPVHHTSMFEEATGGYIVVSAVENVEAFGGQRITETAIFLANEDGQMIMVAPFSVLDDVADHKAALEAAGLSLVEAAAA